VCRLNNLTDGCHCMWLKHTSAHVMLLLLLVHWCWHADAATIGGRRVSNTSKHWLACQPTVLVITLGSHELAPLACFYAHTSLCPRSGDSGRIMSTYLFAKIIAFGKPIRRSSQLLCGRQDKGCLRPPAAEHMPGERHARTLATRLWALLLCP